MLKRVLVTLDGSPLAESILPYVSSLAQGLDAEVTLLHVTHIPDEIRESTGFHASVERGLETALTGSVGPQTLDEPAHIGGHHPTIEQIIERAELQAKDYLQGVAGRLQAAGVNVRTAISVGDAEDEIVRYAQHEGMDLIAMATHGRSGLQRWLHGSVTEEVLQRTQTPLLLIHPSEESTAPASPAISEIVVPLDGSPLAEAVLPYAEALATGFKVPIVLLRAIETVYIFSDPSAGAAAGYQDILEALQEAAEGYLQEKATDLQAKGLSVTTLAPTGTPASEITGYAQDHPGSLIVIATHGRTGIVGALLGSVARRVLRSSGVPTLVVRPTPAPPA